MRNMVRLHTPQGDQWLLNSRKGPIVRISPWELSIRDSDFYYELYVAGSTRRTDSWARGREGNGFDGMSFLQQELGFE